MCGNNLLESRQPEVHAFFISNTFISTVRMKLAKNQAKTKQHPEKEFCYLKIVRFVHPRSHAKIIRGILKMLKKTTTSV